MDFMVTYKGKRFKKMGDWSEGFAWVQNLDNKFGFINKKGMYIYQPIFDNVNTFIEGRAAVQLKNKWGFIDYDGNYAICPCFNSCGVFCENRASVNYKGMIDRYGFIIDR